MKRSPSGGVIGTTATVTSATVDELRTVGRILPIAITTVVTAIGLAVFFELVATLLRAG